MDSSQPSEHVLVIPRERLTHAGLFSGFRPYDATFARSVLDPAMFQFRSRDDVEYDPAWVQLIPYIVLTWDREVFHYTRGSGLEDRLPLRRSIGLGGHIRAEDAVGDGDAYRAGMLRELHEEVEILSTYHETMMGFLYDPSMFVGELHLGIVHRLTLREPMVFARESSIDAAGFSSVAELRRLSDSFESWSKWVLEQL